MYSRRSPHGASHKMSGRESPILGLDKGLRIQEEPKTGQNPLRWVLAFFPSVQNKRPDREGQLRPITHLVWKMWEDLLAVTVIEGDAVFLIIGDESQGLCSKTAPLAERLEQDCENRVFFIAFH